MNPRDLQLTLAAAQAAGPCPPGEEAAWAQRVRDLAFDLYVLGDTVGQDLNRLDGAKQFTATLLLVRIETSSTRGVLVLRNSSGEREQLRTDRSDSDAGRAMVDRARALVGHRVRVYRINETMAGNAKMQVRVAVHLVDGGADTDPVPEASAKQVLLEEAENDTAAARTAWAAASLPDSGSVTVHQLIDALGHLPGVTS